MNYEGCRGKSAKRFNNHTAWGLDAAWRPYQFEIMNYVEAVVKSAKRFNNHTAWGLGA